jgi:diadenosine tetraphosphate (Ap4A) HIT family hydrolase
MTPILNTINKVMKNCPFCNLSETRIIQRNSTGLCIRDGFPISSGHTLIIPHRHVGSFFELTDVERSDLLKLLDWAKLQLTQAYHPDGWNVGINDGAAAGQTVPHLHIHLIPRYTGDVADPRGGVRWVIPDKANYWSSE